MYKAPQSPKVAELTYSGTPNAQSYTYTMTINQQTTNFLSVSSNTDIVLSAGQYYAIAYPDFTRTASSRRNQIHWFIDGVQIGSVGGSDHFNNESTDNAEATFTLISTGTLTLRQTDWSGNAITLTSDARALVWKMPL